MSTNLRIDHKDFGSTSSANEVKRAALFTEDYKLIEHYVFPAISGGKVMTVIPLGADKPGGAPRRSDWSCCWVTLVDAVSTESDGSYTGVATTSANGAGLTVSYDVAGGTASNLAIVAAGDGYQAGDSFTVVGDTGVTGTVSI